MIRLLLAVLMLAGATAAPAADNPPEATFCPRITYAFDPASNNVQLYADAISNPASTTTGPLRFELWGFNTSTHFGYLIATSASFGTLRPSQSMADVTVTAPFASPPDGSYFLVLYLTEQSSTCSSDSGYCLVNSGNFSGTQTFPLIAPPPPPPPPPPITIGNYISGNWFDPTTGQDGHGVQFEVLPGNGIIAIWFVFTPDGTGQTWLYAQGSYDPTSSTVTLPAFLSLGGRFPPNFDHADNTVTQWGTLTIAFADCNNGTLAWSSTVTGYPPSGSFPIARATSIAGTSCP
jgi:hypothetical protein